MSANRLAGILQSLDEVPQSFDLALGRAEHRGRRLADADRAAQGGLSLPMRELEDDPLFVSIAGSGSRLSLRSYGISTLRSAGVEANRRRPARTF